MMHEIRNFGAPNFVLAGKAIDVRARAPDPPPLDIPGDTRPPRQSYRWVELGRGTVDVPGVMAALKKLPFNGPAIIELDAVPEPGRTPKESAEINKRYVVERLGLSL